MGMVGCYSDSIFLGWGWLGSIFVLRYERCLLILMSGGHCILAATDLDRVRSWSNVMDIQMWNISWIHKCTTVLSSPCPQLASWSALFGPFCFPLYHSYPSFLSPPISRLLLPFFPPPFSLFTLVRSGDIPVWRVHVEWDCKTYVSREPLCNTLDAVHNSAFCGAIPKCFVK